MMEESKGIESIAFLIGLTLIIVGIAVIADTWSFTQGTIDDFASEERYFDNYITQEFDCNEGDKIKGEVKSEKLSKDENDNVKYPFNIYILNEKNFEKFPQKEGLEYAYVKENINEVDFEVKVFEEGIWYVVIDNAKVEEGAKEGDLDLAVEYYVKKDSNFKYFPIILGVVIVGIGVYLKYFYQPYDDYEEYD